MISGSEFWERPESVSYPHIWRRFKGRKEINGSVSDFWVRDIIEEEIEIVVNCMVEKYCRDEPLTKYCGLVNDQESVESYRRLWIDVLKRKLGIICYMEDPDSNGKPIFAAVNCTYAKTKFDKRHSFSGKAITQVMNTAHAIMGKVDAFKFLGTDVLLSGMGLYVLPEFRGQGLGLELLNASEDLCRAFGIKVSAHGFSSCVSQVLAERAGYTVMIEFPYKDLAKLDSRFTYPGIVEHTKSFKYMYKIIND